MAVGGMNHTVVPASIRHVKLLDATLRGKEFIPGLPSRVALRLALMRSPFALTAIIDGRPAAMWGVMRNALSDSGEVWVAIGSEAAHRPIALIKEARRQIEIMARETGTLYAMINREDGRAVAFAGALGFARTFDLAPREGCVAMAFSPPEVHNSPPFIIHGLGRSRTAWLAEFLTYGEWACLHEQAPKLRTMEDLKAMLAQPKHGYSETAASFGWPLILNARPDIKQVVIRRDTQDAIAAMQQNYERNGLEFDRAKLDAIFHRGAKVLERISALPGVLTLTYADLDSEEGCRRIFEFCLPYEWDREWWMKMRDTRVESDLIAIVSDYQQHRDDIEAFKSLSRRELVHLVRSGRVNHGLH